MVNSLPAALSLLCLPRHVCTHAGPLTVPPALHVLPCSCLLKVPATWHYHQPTLVPTPTCRARVGEVRRHSDGRRAGSSSEAACKEEDGGHEALQCHLLIDAGPKSMPPLSGYSSKSERGSTWGMWGRVDVCGA